jgi:dolichyl-phosphate-mannose-protein mannosyltransferase
MKRLLTPELLVLTVLSAASHFWRLFQPNAVVFDEVYFKEFAGHYLAHTFYIDVHPPLANLLYAAVARIAAIPADTLLGDAPVSVLRVLPALCGTLIVPLGYVLLRQLGATRRVATLGGVALLCENALLVDTRFSLVEPLIMCAGLATLTSYLGARASHGARRWGLLALAALLAGASLSLKWTGASALAMILALWAFDAWHSRPIATRTLGEGAVLVAIPTAVYVTTFAVHFALLTHIGVGQSAMPPVFHRTLIGDPTYDSTVHVSLVAKIRDAHAVMSRGNFGLRFTTHPASSRWYTWPIMKHPIALWENERAGPDQRQVVVLLGNPVLWWGALAGVIGAAVWLLRRKSVSATHRFAVAFLVGGFAINFVPFIFIRRLMYLYHYLFALVFGVLVSVYWLGTIMGWNERDEPLFSFESRRSARLYWAVFALVVLSFLYFLPLSYGFVMSQTAFDARFWILHPHL